MRHVLIALMLCLGGCALKVDNKPIDKLPLHISDPAPLKLKKVEFIVIHKDNAAKAFADLEKAGIEPVVFGLTGTDYKSLAIDIQDIKNYLILQREILRKYRNYYEGDK